VRVRRQQRAVEDGFSNPLLPGVRASADAERLAQELAFSYGRLRSLEGAPEAPAMPGFYADLRVPAVAGGAGGAEDGEQAERAFWSCLLTAYLCPLEDAEPFAGIRAALSAAPSASGELPDLSQAPLGPRSSHDPARGGVTLQAYRSWYEQAGSQASAFTGDAGWTPERRFERLFERLALPGLQRAARYELLVLLGALGLRPLQADALHVAGGRGVGAEDATTLAAKRIFAIGDTQLLERRARALAEAVEVPLSALDLALANWGAEQRATLGFDGDASDEQTLSRARAAFGL
jgi:hypothetical protein